MQARNEQPRVPTQTSRSARRVPGDSRPDEVLEDVRQRFAAFRRTYEPRTRIPNELRRAVLAALKQGVSMSALRGTCGLSARQVEDWHLDLPGTVPGGGSVAEPARVFAVADDSPADNREPRERSMNTDGRLELRVGAWAITVRPLES